MVLIVRRNRHSHIVFIYMLYRIDRVWYRSRVDIRPHTTDVVVLCLISRVSVWDYFGTHQNLGFWEDIF